MAIGDPNTKQCAITTLKPSIPFPEPYDSALGLVLTDSLDSACEESRCATNFASKIGLNLIRGRGK
jgi:hypothetical protein